LPEANNNGSYLEAEGIAWGAAASLKAGDPPVIKDLNLVVRPGTWIAVTGPSGAGKTTLLSICAGLLKPTGGKVSLFGQSLDKLSDEDVSRLRGARLGLVFQNYHLDDSRNALENILLPAYFGQSNWHDLNVRAQKLGENLGLNEHLSKPSSVLSGGQRQRVAVCRALLNSPKLILADEPTGALDHATAESVLNVLSEQVEHGASVVSVTHNSAVLERADQKFTFSDGQLEEVAS
jgi:putative ABC transport system ATP-binding protein